MEDFCDQDGNDVHTIIFPGQGPFVALAGFYVVWTFFGLGGDEEPAAVMQSARAHCGRPWGDVNSRLGHHINVEKYCMWGPYVAHLLTAGLGLSTDDFSIGEYREPLDSQLGRVVRRLVSDLIW